MMPTSAPSITETVTTISAIDMVSWLPTRRRESTSRPSRSVPMMFHGQPAGAAKRWRSSLSPKSV